MQRETVAALLTPLAPGAIAVIALRGPKTRFILNSILRKRRNDEAALPGVRRPALRRIVDGREQIDDAVVVILDDESAELSVHGGVRVAQRLLALLERLGATIVRTEEFGRGSSRNPIEAAVDAALLRTYSRRLGQWLLYQRTHLAGHLPTLRDRSEQERTSFAARTRIAINVVRGLRIAIIGPPNAGKSTLANRLIGHERIITSDIPGTTRDWVDEEALIEGWPVTLIDTAGIRTTACDIEAASIQRGRERVQTVDLCLIVMDATTSSDGRAEQQREAEEILPEDLPRLIVISKCDLARTAVGMNEVVVSARTGEGIALLEARIAQMLGLNLLETESPTGFMPEHLSG